MGWMALIAALLALIGCDAQRAEKLVEDVSTETEVRAQFGEPKTVTIAADGTRTLEYPRQPEGVTNYVIVIGANGKMSSLRQLLNADNFARIKPGMDRAELRQILGPHASTQRFELKKHDVLNWRFAEGTQTKVFSVTLGADGKVVETAIGEDPRQTTGG
jgi:hypothetical protein